MLVDKIKTLREHAGMTQADLARKLGLTRSSINGWEMGLSVPSTATIVALSKLFHVTSDYLLSLENGAVLRADHLSQKEISLLANLIDCMQKRSGDNEIRPPEAP